MNKNHICADKLTQSVTVHCIMLNWDSPKTI